VIYAAIVLLAAALLLSGCKGEYDEQVDECRKLVQSQLKSPSSYNEISYDIFLMQAERERYESISDYDDRPHVNSRHIYLKFDAVNSFNVPLRMLASCYFDASNGEILNGYPKIYPISGSALIFDR
jgi:hypothetical protein